MLTAILLSAAAAAEPQISASLAVEDSWNDPFTHSPQLAAGAAWWIRDWASVELHASFSPTLGQSGWKPLMGQLTDHEVYADIADVRSKATLEAHVAPFRSQVGPFESSAGLFLGAGVLYSQNPVYLDLPPDMNPKELSPAVRLGVEGSVWREALGVRLQIAQTRYSEEIDDYSSERNHLWVGLGLQWRS